MLPTDVGVFEVAESATTRRGAAALVAGVVVLAVALAGCTSSGSSAASQSPAPTPTTSSAPPSSSAAPSTSSAPSTSAAPKPLSAFEQDPAVQAIRKWTAAGGRTVNSGRYTSAALRELMTPGLAAQAKLIFGPDVGGYYPGPLPYQPTGVTVTDASHRTVRGCVENNGWVLNKKTRKPVHPLQVTAADFQAVKQSGQWLVSAFYADKKVSCTRVKVNTRTW